MSVNLSEVIEQAGFDTRNDPEDAKWLLSQQDEFDGICREAEELAELYDEYLDYCELQEGLNEEIWSWDKWKKETGNSAADNAQKILEEEELLEREE